VNMLPPPHPLLCRRSLCGSSSSSAFVALFDLGSMPRTGICCCHECLKQKVIVGSLSDLDTYHIPVVSPSKLVLSPVSTFDSFHLNLLWYQWKCRAPSDLASTRIGRGSVAREAVPFSLAFYIQILPLGKVLIN
jgi:hypothetical protein